MSTFPRSPHGLVCAALAILIAALPLAGQSTGISLAVTPTAERIYWHDDLVLDDAWYYGGRASFGFGRYVALQGYYLHGDDVASAALDALETARRYGGEVEFTFADWRLTPFLRAGAALSEFEIGGAADDLEILTATAAAGIRLHLFDRLETQVFVQDVAFRLAASSPLVAPGVIADGETETFHNLAVGAGINLRLGGETGQPETDRAFRDGVRGIRSPLELYAGEIRWDRGVGVPDVTVGGARLGLDFGPYVGIRGYYFGSLEDDLDEFTEYFGYGAEGRFHLSRRDEGLTPFLVLGGGRIHFPGAIAEGAVFEDDRKWNAIAGGGVEFRLGDRIGLHVAARDLVLSGVEPGSTTDPDQLHHNWLFSGGFQLAFGAGADRDRPEAAGRPPVAAEPARETADPAAERTREADPELAREIRALRAEVDSLRGDLRRTAAGQDIPDPVTAPPIDTIGDTGRVAVRPAPAPIEPRTIELPVLDQGVIYIRFGEAEAVRTAAPATPAAPAEAAAAPPDTVAAGAPASDTVQALLEELEARLEARPDAGPERQAERDRLERLELLLSERLASLERELRALQRTDTPPQPPAEVRVEVAAEARPADVVARPADVVAEPRPSRGVFRGDRVGLYRIAPQLGIGLEAPNQVLLGLKADIGSAFGGSIRVLPELVFGVTDDATWNANVHLEWPVPFEYEGVQPWIGAGAGILHDGGTDLLIPNVLAGLTYPMGDHRLFGTLQGLDFFDETRLLLGLSLRPPPFLRSGEPETVAAAELVEPTGAAPPAPAPDTVIEPAPPPATPARADTAPAELPARPDAPREVPDTVDRAPPEEPAEPAPPLETLMRETADLTSAPAVLDVRRMDRGVAVVLGGADLFPTGGAGLTSAARSTVRRLAEQLVERSELTVAVEGHTDDRGQPSVNDPLSRRRAESVRDALVAYGVAPSRVSVAGYGASRPIADNATAAGRAQNRRVEVILMVDR